MCILRALAAFKHIWLSRDIFFPILRLDFRKRLLLGFIRNAYGISTHVGNQSCCALALQVYAFIKLLCNEHGQLRGKAQLA